MTIDSVAVAQALILKLIPVFLVGYVLVAVKLVKEWTQFIKEFTNMYGWGAWVVSLILSAFASLLSVPTFSTINAHFHWWYYVVIGLATLFISNLSYRYDNTY